MRRDTEVHRITSASPDPTRESMHRERQYLLLMGLRMVAIVVAVMVPGVWRWIAVAAGVALPYFAVILVNAVKVRDTEDDPDFVASEPVVAVADKPFSGKIIPHD